MPFKEKLSRLDFPGITLVIGAVCCLVLALQWGGQTKPWGSADVVGLLVGAALLAIAFGIVQWRKGDRATIPLRVLRQRTILMGAFYLFFLEMAIYAVRCPQQRPRPSHLLRVANIWHTVPLLSTILLSVCPDDRCHTKRRSVYTSWTFSDRCRDVLQYLGLVIWPLCQLAQLVIP